MKIKKNFLSKTELQSLKELMLASDFAWYYKEHQVEHEKDHPFLHHSVYRHGLINSPFYESHFKCLISVLKSELI